MQIQPFFARFLESQKTLDSSALTKLTSPASMQTMAYPSDSDTHSGKLLAGVRLDAFRAPGLQNAPSSGGSQKPGDVVTLAYPSDSDVQEGRLHF
jgi:hypothetical protein